MKLKFNEHQRNIDISDKGFEYYIKFSKIITLEIIRLNHNEMRMLNIIFRYALDKVNRNIMINFYELS